MNFNKNNPRFRKPRLTSGRRRKDGFFTKLGSRADSLWRKLKGGPPADADGENRPHRPHPPVPPDFLEDLKRDTGVEEIYVLESERLFKIKVGFTLADGTN